MDVHHITLCNHMFISSLTEMHFVFVVIIFLGIPPHVDTHSAFEDTILSLSLGAKVRSQYLL